MDPLRNPFAPGAGTQPPQLAGRAALLDEAALALDRLRLGRSTRSQIFVGLRGVGKTVLLNRVRELAEERNFQAVQFEADEDRPLAALLIPPMRKILFSLDTAAGISEKTKLGLRVLRSFLGRFSGKLRVHDLGELEIGFEPERGTADSGILESDLSDLFVAVADAAKDRGTQICLLLDEMQYLSESELGSLIMALHQTSQRGLPLILVGAGLPHILGLAGRSKSYAERLFTFPALGALSPEAARLAVQAPVQEQQVEFDEGAIAAIFADTQGYPYFLQQWGYESWNVAPASPITAEHVFEAGRRAIAQLDESFFRVRFDRLTRREKDYLFAMLAVGGREQRSGEIAEKLGIKTTSLGPLRSSLIAKGMIYSPSHGDNAFTVPLFDDFLRRQLAQA
ncbi:MAG: ATP-binding protein [Acidobacteriaceae bacterium]